MWGSKKLVAAAVLASFVAALGLTGCAETQGVNPTSSELSTQAVESGRGGLLQALDLTEEQREQLEALREGHREKMQELRASLGESGSGEAMMEARKALRESMHTELASILTTNQLAEFDRLRAERGERHGKHMRRGGRMNAEDRAARRQRRMEHMTEALGLSADQQEQIRLAFEELRPARGDQQVRGQHAKRGERRAEMEAALKGILTADQFETFLGIRAERGAGNRKGRSPN